MNIKIVALRYNNYGATIIWTCVQNYILLNDCSYSGNTYGKAIKCGAAI